MRIALPPSCWSLCVYFCFRDFSSVRRCVHTIAHNVYAAAHGDLAFAEKERPHARNFFIRSCPDERKRQKNISCRFVCVFIKCAHTFGCSVLIFFLNVALNSLANCPSQVPINCTCMVGKYSILNEKFRINILNRTATEMFETLSSCRSAYNFSFNTFTSVPSPSL